MAYRVVNNTADPPSSNDFSTLSAAMDSFSFNNSGHLPFTDVDIIDLEGDRTVHCWQTGNQTGDYRTRLTAPSPGGDVNYFDNETQAKHSAEILLTANGG